MNLTFSPVYWMTGWLQWGQASRWPWSAISLFPRGTLQSLMVLQILPFFLTLPSGSRSLVCVSFKNLFIHFVVRFMFREVSQTSLGLEKTGLDSGFSPAACLPGRGGSWRPVWVVVVCVVLGSVDPLFPRGAGRPFVWSLERLDRVSLQNLALFLICVCI